MNHHELRFVELTCRLGILTKMKSQVAEELENKAVIMFAQAFDKDAELKQAGTIAILDKWIKEIIDELNSYEDKVFVKYMRDVYNETEDRLKSKVNKQGR